MSSESRGFRKPERGPTAAEIADRDRFRELSQASLSTVRTSAEAWRNGMSALVTLITGGLLISGPDMAQDLTTGWRTALTILAGGGLAAATWGLWRALRAAAGVPRLAQLDDIVTRYGSVAAFEVAQARTAAAELRRARVALQVALLLLGAAALSWWWAEPAPPEPPAYVRVDTEAGSVCGTLQSADQATVRVQVAGEAVPREIGFAEVENLRLATSC